MLTYIPLSPENIEEAIALVRSVFPSDFGTEDSPEEAYRASIDPDKHKAFIERHHLDILQYFIVKDANGKTVGVTGWYTEKPGPEDTIWLGWYCIDPAERGKGLGKEILQWSISQVKEMGYKKLKLYTSDDPNEATAQILYEKLGFALVGEEQKEGEEYKILFREKNI
jgi:GNAT superfamily N-acetyltransferase